MSQPLVVVPVAREGRYERWTLYVGTIPLCGCFGGHWSRQEAVDCPVALKAFLKLGGKPAKDSRDGS